MKKKTLITILSISTLLILGPMVYFGLLRPGKVSGGWFNDSWLYRKAITFNNSGSAASNQKVKVDANTAALVDPNTVNFNTADLTFTPGMAKRNAGTGSTAPFASGILVQGEQEPTATWNTGDSGLLTDNGNATVINGNFRRYFDSGQGSVVFWITPEWNGNDGRNHFVMNARSNYYWSIRKTSSNVIAFYDGTGNLRASTSTSNWIAGNTYLVVVRWDLDNTLNGTNYASISVNDVVEHIIHFVHSVKIPLLQLMDNLGIDWRQQITVL